jgi:hypothetical protein
MNLIVMKTQKNIINILYKNELYILKNSARYNNFGIWI